MMFSHEVAHGRAEAGGPDVRGDDGPAGMTFFYEAVHGRVDRPFEAAMAPPA